MRKKYNTVQEIIDDDDLLLRLTINKLESMARDVLRDEFENSAEFRRRVQAAVNDLASAKEWVETHQEEEEIEPIATNERSE